MSYDEKLKKIDEKIDEFFDSARIETTILIIVILLLLGFLTLGCNSTCQKCQPCPEINIPTVTKVPIKEHAKTLPLPKKPDIISQKKNSTTTERVIILDHNYREMERVAKEAIDIIKANNKEAQKGTE